MFGGGLKTLAEVGGQRAAIGVAQNQQVGSRLFRGLERLQGIGRVGFVAVKEMLGVIDHFPAMGFQEGHGIPNQVEIFLQRDAQGHFHVQVPGLPEDRHHRRAGFDQRLQILVVGHAVARVAGAAKRREFGVLQFQFPRALEKGHVLGIRAGPAAFDVVHSQFVEFPGDVELVFQGKRDVFALRAVPQSRIVDLNLFHSFILSWKIRIR